jgi:hypothetical protein
MRGEGTIVGCVESFIHLRCNMVVAVTGHRKVMGTFYEPYAPNVWWRRLEEWTSEHLSNRSISRLITGMAIGVDQMVCSIAIGLGIPVHAYIPCRSQSAVWPPASQAYYTKLLAEIRDSGGDITYCTEGPYVPGCMSVRDRMMVNACESLVAYWDGVSHGGTSHTVQLALQVERPIIRVPSHFFGGTSSD